MATTKLNVLQLHLSGSDSFPLAVPSRPKLVRGAFSKHERYTLRDLAGLNEYAAARGIRVIVELDTPGHAGSWCVGMPELCPDPLSCRQPLGMPLAAAAQPGAPRRVAGGSLQLQRCQSAMYGGN